MTIEVDWLDRSLIVAPHFCLCLTEEEYLQACEDLGISKADQWVWVPDGKNGCMHTVQGADGKTAFIVVLRKEEGVSGIQIAGLLVHEAVHMFQRFCEDLGEKEPSAEFEAYSIQHISQQLMQSYAGRTT